MKNCRDIKNNLPLYPDNLSSEDKLAVENHLNVCPGCTKALEQLQKTEKLVKNLPEVEPPAWFKQKIMAEVRRESEKKSFVQKWFYPLKIKIPIQVFTTVVIAVLAFYIYRTGNEQIKETLPLSIPAPIAENQKVKSGQNQKLESGKEAVTREKVINKDSRNDVTRNESSSGVATSKTEEPINTSALEKVQQMDAAVAKDANRQVTPELKANEYASAPVKSFELPAAAKMKRSKKESNISESAMNARSAPQAQSSIRHHLSLKVENIDAAVKEVDYSLSRNDAKNITRQLTPNKAILTAEIKNQKIKDFLENLKTIGQISGSIPGDNGNKYLYIVIEIMK